MKGKFTTFILIFIMIFLIIAIAIFAFMIYLDVTKTNSVPTVDTIVANFQEKIDINKSNTAKQEEINSDKIAVEPISTEEAKIETNDGFFYSQLTGTQRQIYNGLYQNKENMTDGTYEIQFGDIFTDILKQEGGSKTLGDDYQSAVEAFLYDNPDVFYVDANKLYLNVETTSKVFSKKFNVYIGPANNGTYYVKGFNSKAQVQEAKRKIERIKNNILANLPNDDYKKILKIHDYLIENIEYDQNYSSIGSYNIYGAFIDRTCVCEGYAKALKYLLDAANIPCEIVQGIATNSSGKTENHAWNCVYLKKSWYYIDTTWDDPIIIGNGRVAKSTNYKYFLKGANQMNKDHELVYRFSDNGRLYRYPEVSVKDYK